MSSEQKQPEMSGAEMRKAAHETKMTKKSVIEDSREEFRKYFIGLKKQLKLEPEIENVIWLHLKATGMATKDKFNDGVKHFGYKI